MLAESEDRLADARSDLIGVLDHEVNAFQKADALEVENHALWDEENATTATAAADSHTWTVLQGQADDVYQAAHATDTADTFTSNL